MVDAALVHKNKKSCSSTNVLCSTLSKLDIAWEEPRAVGDLVHVETFFARNLGGLIHARTRVPGRLGKATSRTPSMYVDEKSDEAVVPAKRLNKGRRLSAEVVEGRASPKGSRR